MDALTLLTVMAFFFLFAVAWHDESARDERKAQQTNRQPSIKTAPRENNSGAAPSESRKVSNT